MKRGLITSGAKLKKHVRHYKAAAPTHPSINPLQTNSTMHLLYRKLYVSCILNQTLRTSTLNTRYLAHLNRQSNPILIFGQTNELLYEHTMRTTYYFHSAELQSADLNLCICLLPPWDPLMGQPEPRPMKTIRISALVEINRHYIGCGQHWGLLLFRFLEGGQLKDQPPQSTCHIKHRYRRQREQCTIEALQKSSMPVEN